MITVSYDGDIRLNGSTIGIWWKWFDKKVTLGTGAGERSEFFAKSEEEIISKLTPNGTNSNGGI
jgi:hypothetical protein